MSQPAITILDPSGVRVGRVEDAGRSWIVTTYEFDLDGEPTEARIVVGPDEFMTFIVASLNALGFPEGDLEYLAARYTKEIA